MFKIRRTTTLHTREVPRDLKDHFKAYCSRRGYSMQAAVIALLKMAISRDIKLKDARK